LITTKEALKEILRELPLSTHLIAHCVSYHYRPTL